MADRPIGVLAVLVGILVFGALLVPQMRIRLIDANQFQGGGVYVSLGMQGLSTRETLDRITRPAEEIVRSLPAAGNVTSNSRSGSSFLRIQPAEGVDGLTLVRQLTQAFTSHQYRFPAKMSPPRVNSWSSDSMPLAVIALSRGDLSEEAFRDFIERVLIPSLQTVPGVARAETEYLGQPSVQVAFTPERLAALGYDGERAYQAITSGLQETPAHALPTLAAGEVPRHVRVLPANVTPTTVGGLRLDGRTSLVEVATVEQRDPMRDNYRFLVDGQPGDGVVVYATADANVYGASHRVAEIVAQESAGLGLSAHLVMDSHRGFDEIAHEILVAAGWCVGFSLLFLVLFLRRWRIALLVCAALPLSLAMAAVAMAVGGAPLTLLTMIGFLLASGMVVDNAIVIAESLMRARSTSDPLERRTVLRRAASAVAMAIIVSTLTTLAMFLPLVVSRSDMGSAFLSGMAQPIVWSLLASLVVALVLVPMAFVRLYPRGMQRPGHAHIAHSRWLIATERWYGRRLACLLLHPALGLCLAGVLLGTGIVAYAWLETPEQQYNDEERQVELRASMIGKVDLDRGAEVLAQWTRDLAPHREELGITCVLGNTWSSGAQLTLYLVPVDRAGRSKDDIRRAAVRLLKPHPTLLLQEHQQMAQLAAVDARQRVEQAEREQQEREQKAQEDKVASEKRSTAANTATDAQTATAATADADSPDADTPDADEPAESLNLDWLSFKLTGPDPRAVVQARLSLQAVLEAEGGIANEQDQRWQRYGARDERPDRGNLTLALTRAAEEQGWRADQVAQQVARFSGGERGTTMPGGWLLAFGRTEESDRTLAGLLETVVYQPSNSIVPGSGQRPRARPDVSAGKTSASSTQRNGKPADQPTVPVHAPLLGLVQRASAPVEQSIRRINGLTEGSLQVTIRASERQRILAAFPSLLVRAGIPDGVSVRLSQDTEQIDEGIRTMVIAALSAAFIIYLIMCILYESLLAPLTVMTTVPAGILSVLGIYAAAGLPLDPMVFLGLFLLVGIVINHGVVLVDRLGVTVAMPRLIGADGRLSRRAQLAVAAASRRRFTPVLLTSLTTIAAAVPMAFSPGTVFGFPIAGLGLSLSIGLSAATLFTLLVVPVVYQWLGITRAGTMTLLRGGSTP